MHSQTHPHTRAMRGDTLKGTMNWMTAAPACVCPECQTSCSYTNRYAHTDAYTHNVYTPTHTHSSQTDAAVWESVSIDTRQHVLYNKHCPRKRRSKPVGEGDNRKIAGERDRETVVYTCVNRKTVWQVKPSDQRSASKQWRVGNIIQR